MKKHEHGGTAGTYDIYSTTGIVKQGLTDEEVGEFMEESGDSSKKYFVTNNSPHHSHRYYGLTESEDNEMAEKYDNPTQYFYKIRQEFDNGNYGKVKSMFDSMSEIEQHDFFLYCNEHNLSDLLRFTYHSGNKKGYAHGGTTPTAWQKFVNWLNEEI